MTNSIRFGQRRDGPALQEIERLAGARFAEVGFAEVAAHDPLSIGELHDSMLARRCWVAVDDIDQPVGYVVLDELDGCPHVEQVSVHPDHQGRGWGRRLMDEVETWAVTHGYGAVTLTTFSDVAWNGPWYAARGYSVMTETEIGPELAARRAEEAAHGLDPADRSCMIKRVRPVGALRPLPT